MFLKSLLLLLLFFCCLFHAPFEIFYRALYNIYLFCVSPHNEKQFGKTQKNKKPRKNERKKKK